MPFRARNAYYLRITERNVIPLYVYLDERHLEWMSDRVLQHVISDLRPRILDKLRTESDAKSLNGSSVKGSVDTHRGDDYQFCYFLRKTEPHSVVLKNRTFIAATRQPVIRLPEPPSNKGLNSRRRKRKNFPSPQELTNNETAPLRSKRRKSLGRDEDADDSTRMDVDDHATEQNDDYHPSSDSSDDDLVPTNPLRKHKQKNKHKRVGDGIIDENDMATIEETSQLQAGLVVEEEEEKPKPILNLKYRGFNIFGLCICVVVEPWPHFRYSMVTRAPSLAPIHQRSSVTPTPAHSSETIPPSTLRERTPLFLPEDSERETPAPVLREPQPHPLFNGMTPFDDDDGSDDGGMMAFSQVLHATGDYRAGAANDEEDNIGEVFFGDADEYREI